MLVGRALTGVLGDVRVEGLDLLAIIGKLHGLEVFLVRGLSGGEPCQHEQQGQGREECPFHTNLTRKFYE